MILRVVFNLAMKIEFTQMATAYARRVFLMMEKIILANIIVIIAGLKLLNSWFY